VITDLLESKTAKMWLIIIGVGFAMIIFATVMTAAGVSVPFVTEFFSLLGVGGGATTTRNVMVDGPQRQMVTQATVTAPEGPLQPTVPIGSDAAAAAAPAPSQQGYVMPSPPSPP
jgi:hypothetical protein